MTPNKANKAKPPIGGYGAISKFVCSHCGKSFVVESVFLRHVCPQMKRDAELKSPTGQTAWAYYQQWMKAMGRMPPDGNAFKTSKFFRTFINFVEFVQKVNLPKVDWFIKMMVRLKYPPTMWISNDVYVIYIEFLDKQMSGVDHALLSIETLIGYSDRHGIPVEECLDVMTVQELIRFLRLRKISPWLLLFCKGFRRAFVERATPEQQMILESLIRPDYWPDQFSDHPDWVQTIRELVAEIE